MKAQQSQGAEFQQSVAAARPESAQEAAALIARCCPPYNALSAGTESAHFCVRAKWGGQGSDLSDFSISMDCENGTIVLFFVDINNDMV